MFTVPVQLGSMPIKLPPGVWVKDDGDWLLKLFSQAESSGGVTSPRPPGTESIREGLSLFDNGQLRGDYAFAKTALQQLSHPNPIAQFNTDDASQIITLTSPLDLQERLRVALPLEVRDGDHRYALCAEKGRVAQAIEQARQAKEEEENWPKLHYLWPQHPIMEWLSDRVLTAFGRHRASVIQCPQLAEGEQAFILMGLIPNRKGQPLLIEWQVALYNRKAWSLQSFPEFAVRTHLKAGTLANRNQGIDASLLQDNLPGAVATMQSYMVTLQQDFSAKMAHRLSGTVADLKRLQDKQFEQLELRLAATQQAEHAVRKLYVANLIEFFRDKPLGAITAQDVMAYRTQRRRYTLTTCPEC